MPNPIELEDPFARHPLGGAVGKTVRSTVRGVVAVDPREEAPPEKTVLLDHVALSETVLTRPLNGVSLYFGKSDLHAVLHAAFQAARAQALAAYEVTVAVDITEVKQVGALRAEDLEAEAARAPADREHFVIYLHRMPESGCVYLEDVFRSEIEGLRDPRTGQIDHEVRSWRFPRIVGRYPHLLDAVAAHPDFSHVIMFVWDARVPGANGGVIDGAKIATLYRADRVVEITTIGALFISAVLPAIGGTPEVREALDAKGFRSAGPAM